MESYNSCYKVQIQYLFRMVVVQSCNIRHDEPDYDNIQHHADDNPSDHDANSIESEDEEELNGIVLRTFYCMSLV